MSSAGSAVDLQLLQAAALLDSDPAAAGRAAAGILRVHPDHVAAALMLGAARRGCGDAAGAVEVFAALATAQPASGVLQLELGRALAAAGRAGESAAAFTRATKLEPELAQAWRELAAHHAASGDMAACDAAYANFTHLAGEESHLAQARSALADRRLDSAETQLRQRLARAPDDVIARRLLAQVAFERGDYPQSEQLLEECLRLAPGYSRARADLVIVLQVRQKAAAMLPHLARLQAAEPDNVHYRMAQAGALALLGDTDGSSQILLSLLQAAPEDANVWLRHGHNLRTAGRLPEAVAAYHRSIQLQPDFGEAWFSLANLKTYHFGAAEIEALRAQLARADLAEKHRLQFEFALGKALEDAHDFAGSFEHYARGNALRRAVLRYRAQDTSELVTRSNALYSREFLEARAGWGCPAPDPIFIVGLPRAGSTLIEQVLASHSQVEGTRELPDIQGLALELGARRPGARAAYPESVAGLSRAQLSALGERYLELTRPHRVLGRPHFIDKMPDNVLHTGLIHLILPNARIIDARRGALACCFSNFKQHFQQGAWFSYSLEDLGHYYLDYERLTAHWDEVLPGRLHRVRYEQLIADLDGVVRALLAYCGLPFEAQCLRFHENPRRVQTASSEQVRRPLYREALDQWRNFEPWLGPLKQVLGEPLDR